LAVSAYVALLIIACIFFVSENSADMVYQGFLVSLKWTRRKCLWSLFLPLPLND